MRVVTLLDRIGLVASMPRSLADDLPTGPWTVVHVRPRQDFRAFDDLTALRVPLLLLGEECRRRRPGKGIVRSRFPLLPGYLFAPLGRVDHARLYACPRVVRLLTPPDQICFVQELRDLVTLVRAAPTSPILAPYLTPGTPITITAGTLAGCSGVVVRRDGGDYLGIRMQLLGQTVLVRLPADHARATLDDQATRA